MLITLIILALIFNYLNGFHDSSNIVATVISSQALPPKIALRLTALGEFLGPLLFGVAVAKTVGEGLLYPDDITLTVIIAALLGAIIWNLITWYIGLPSSSSHALIGGLLGATIVANGFSSIQINGLSKILIALFISPPLGLIAGFLITRFVLWTSRKASPKINTAFRRMQIFTSFGLALSHGANDGQKTMGVLTLALLTAHKISTFEIPLWVILLSSFTIALGTMFGGWRLIHTLGGRIFRIRPVNGFASQIAGGSVILIAALLGGPVSTTQVMSSAIMGTGAAERINKVRWQIGRDMLVAWLLTIPISGIVAALSYWGLNYWL